MILPNRVVKKRGTNTIDSIPLSSPHHARTAYCDRDYGRPVIGEPVLLELADDPEKK